jgi:hypothetical protein
MKQRKKNLNCKQKVTMQKLILLLSLAIIPVLHGVQEKNMPCKPHIDLTWALCGLEGDQKIIQAINACDPDVPDEQGNLPIHTVATAGFCCSQKLKPYAHALVARTANINHRNNLGETALHLAVGSIGTQQSDIQLLIDSGARWECDIAGNSPLVALFHSGINERPDRQALMVLHLPHIMLADIKKTLACIKTTYSLHKQKITKLFYTLPLSREKSKRLPELIDDFCAQKLNDRNAVRWVLHDLLYNPEKEKLKPIITSEADIRAQDAERLIVTRAVEDLQINRKSITDFKRNGRIIKAYYEAMRVLGYVHPKKDEWQASKQMPFPIELAQKIAYYSSVNQHQLVG